MTTATVPLPTDEGERGPPSSGAAAALAAAGMLASRVLGVIRQSLMARYLGATTGIAADAFMAAFKIPNLLQNLFGEGALSASFIPVYANLLSREDGEVEAGRVAGAVGAILGLVTSVLVLLGILLAPLLIPVIAPGFTGEKRTLTIVLTRVLFPGAGVFVLGAWCLGVLNSHRKFFLSYAAPVLWNLAMIGALVGFGRRQGRIELAVTLAWASVIGAVLTFAVQLPTVLRLVPHLRVALDHRRASVRRVLTNFTPVFFSRGIVQISSYIDQLLASLLPQGMVALLGYAVTINTLPVSLFGMAISAAELPEMSSAIGDEDETAAFLRRRLDTGLRRIAFFVIPSAAAFLALGDVIARALFQSGRFTETDTIFTWGILAGSAVGLLASTLGRLYSSTYYALHDTRTPLRFAILRVVLTTGLGYLFAIPLPLLMHVDSRWGAAGLTASAGFAGWVEFLLLRSQMNRRIGRTGLSRSFVATLWGSSGVAAAAAFAIQHGARWPHRFIMATVVLAAFGLIYGILTLAFRVPEAHALILEANLIKEYRPKYNIALRDDKSYPYIKVTIAELFPRVYVTRQLVNDGSRYFGPYTDVGAMRRALNVVKRIFTVRSCTYDLPRVAPERPCLDYHIGRCKAPCVLLQSQAEYRAMIDEVILFLDGRADEVKRRVKQRIELAAESLDFERAAELRDVLQHLERMEEPTVVLEVEGGDRDVLGFARDGDDACVTWMRIRAGKLLARDHQFFANIDDVTDPAVLEAFLAGPYRLGQERTRELLVPFDLEEREAVEESLEGAKIHVPQRGPRRELVDLATQNARHLLEEARLTGDETEERAGDPIYELQRQLGLQRVPRAMVCFDISHAQGTDTVASCVWFQNGRPYRAEYRKFKVREVVGIDDFASMSEVVRRFFRRRIDEGRSLPDLVVIDGGKGQLNAAHGALEALGLGTLPLISLAKREEEIFVVGRSDSLRLPRRSPALRVLQQARDEAHRFAVTFQRKRRTTRTITSELLRIPGVGERKRRQLLEAFGSLEGVRTAAPEAIAALPGFSLKSAARIQLALSGATPPAVSGRGEAGPLASDADLTTVRNPGDES